ncbi:Heat shock protein Hsp20 [Botryosphaeria dothidea]|uniref:Heat shock protein Hsp20 n=1 Tax=Botryosphaeria dothidea TaxID=55169 RepID=A0A8H4IP16_9PEZI|nr:Heat shock protein Hsp20 [Botryosphaeria dothidea]
MPSIQYVNQSAPFWDFVANLENQGPAYPFFAAPSTENREESSDEEGRRGRGRGPWGHGSWGHGGPAGFHRGPPRPWWGRGPHSPPPHPEGHPPPPHFGGPPPPPPHYEGQSPPPPAPGSNPEDPAQPQEGEPRHDGPPHPHHHRRGHCGRRGGRPGSFGRGGAWGRGPFPMGGPFGFPGMAEAFQKAIFGDNNEEKEAGQEDFQPEADVFDTESAYVIHVSLPGAKKEDVGVSWDAEKSELSIAGVIHRPGDEDFLKTLAMDERKVGAFERKIRLGSRANPAQVDDDSISAKLEDGILRVDVPKLDKDYVEIKKVDIE